MVAPLDVYPVSRTMVQKLDRLFTLFGGGGFSARYVAQERYRTGVRVRVAERNPGQALFLKPLGGLGQNQFVACDITKPDQVAAAISGSDRVADLGGVLKNPHAVNVGRASHLDEDARAAAVHAIVHFAASGADTSAQSDSDLSKGTG